MPSEVYPDKKGEPLLPWTNLTKLKIITYEKTTHYFKSTCVFECGHAVFKILYALLQLCDLCAIDSYGHKIIFYPVLRHATAATSSTAAAIASAADGILRDIYISFGYSLEIFSC